MTQFTLDRSGIRPRTARGVCILLFVLMTSRWIVYGFSEVALSVILRDAGASLAQISLMLAAGALFMFKFLWAPLVDRTPVRKSSRYRTWYVWTQTLLAAGLATLLPFHPSTAFYPIFGLMVAASIIASFRDIAMDGLAIELLDESDRARANGWLSAGFMLGMLLGGGVLLLVYDRIGWQGAIIGMVISTLITAPLMALVREPQRSAAALTDSKRSFLALFRGFFAIPGYRRWSTFLVLHAISAVAGSSLIGVMLVDIHWPVPRIGFILNIVGPAAAVAASFAAGWIFARFARQASLLTMMVIQAVLNLALIPLAADGYQATVAETVVVMLVVASSIANLIIKTVAMDKSAATDDKGTYFSLQGSMSQAGGLVALVAAPAAAQFVGYVPVIFFGLVSGLASAAILLTGSKAPAVAAPTRG